MAHEQKNKMEWIEDELKVLEERGLLIQYRTAESGQGAWITIDGKKVLNFCSNNYLGFANDPRIVSSVATNIQKYGVGVGAVRTIAGNTKLHKELEKKLAKFKRVEDVLLLQSGFVVNSGVIPALVGKEDVIFSDALNHASIIDGCRLSRAKIIPYEHKNVVALEKLVIEHLKSYRRGFLISDGVFSMDGDIAPLPELAAITERHSLFLIVDDAHGEGVLGDHGRGIVDYFRLHGKVDLEVGTLSKAFGVVGGFVAGDKKIIAYLRQKTRPLLFSSALSFADSTACIVATELLENSDETVKKLWENTKYFQKRIQEIGYFIGNTETPITPIFLKDEKKAQEFSKKLFERNIFVTPIVYPVVPKGTARVRIMLSALHTKEDLDYALQVFQELKKNF
jgi:glycine C-acetyltransferase